MDTALAAASRRFRQSCVCVHTWTGNRSRRAARGARCGSGTRFQGGTRGPAKMCKWCCMARRDMYHRAMVSTVCQVSSDLKFMAIALTARALAAWRCSSRMHARVTLDVSDPNAAQTSSEIEQSLIFSKASSYGTAMHGGGSSDTSRVTGTGASLAQGSVTTIFRDNMPARHLD